MNTFLVQVSPKKAGADLAGNALLAEIREDLGFSEIAEIRSATLFELTSGLPRETVLSLCENLFFDPVSEEFSVDSDLFEGFNFCLEIGFIAGVTDNLALTAMRGIEDFLGKKLGENESVKSRRLYFFWGNLFEEKVRAIAVQKLFNPLIEEIRVRRGKQNE